MANWCSNTIVFEGSEETIKQIEKLFQTMKSKEEQTKQGQLPEFITDENGGYFFNIYSNEGDTGIFQYETKWSPNIEIVQILKELSNRRHHRDECKYWLDFGNSQHTGQVLLSTIGNIRQPDSEKYQTVASLPFVTDEFGELLKQSEQADDTPSCSLAEALEKQDLYINSSLTQMGCSLLWSLFRNGMTPYRGFFHNLKDFTTHPIKVA